MLHASQVSVADVHLPADLSLERGFPFEGNQEVPTAKETSLSSYLRESRSGPTNLTEPRGNGSSRESPHLLREWRRGDSEHTADLWRSERRAKGSRNRGGSEGYVPSVKSLADVGFNPPSNPLSISACLFPERSSGTSASAESDRKQKKPCV
jgi:hypothetical protein